MARGRHRAVRTAARDHGGRPRRSADEKVLPLLVHDVRRLSLAHAAARRDRPRRAPRRAVRADDLRRTRLHLPRAREIQLRLWRAGGTGLYAPQLAITVDVPEDRLTKKYFRYWYTTYGVYHSRMRLLDVIDRDGRLAEPSGRTIFGAPGFIYRELARSSCGYGAREAPGCTHRSSRSRWTSPKIG